MVNHVGSVNERLGWNQKPCLKVRQLGRERRPVFLHQIKGDVTDVEFQAIAECRNVGGDAKQVRVRRRHPDFDRVKQHPTLIDSRQRVVFVRGARREYEIVPLAHQRSARVFKKFRVGAANDGAGLTSQHRCAGIVDVEVALIPVFHKKSEIVILNYIQKILRVDHEPHVFQHVNSKSGGELTRASSIYQYGRNARGGSGKPGWRPL